MQRNLKKENIIKGEEMEEGKVKKETNKILTVLACALECVHSVSKLLLAFPYVA